MTRPRKYQISLDATPTYHIICRCVRRAFLCGIDEYDGRSYEHRRRQIQGDLLRLSSIFFIDIAGFSVMSNHYHLLLHVNRDKCQSASPIDIAKRWHQLFSGTDVTQKFVNGEHIEPYEAEQLDTLIDAWRYGLHNISWFMKVLNEGIARRANKEDEVTGHFWESRFKSIALLDEKAVLSCLAYIDLNPIRAGIAATPEQSDYTSIKMRIDHLRLQEVGLNVRDESHRQPQSLMPFVGNPRQPIPNGIPFKLLDYIDLVEWTGRQIREGKRRAIRSDIPLILEWLQIAPTQWLELTTNFESKFKGITGSIQSLKEKCSNFHLTRLSNRCNSKLLYG